MSGISSTSRRRSTVAPAGTTRARRSPAPSGPATRGPSDLKDVLLDAVGGKAGADVSQSPIAQAAAKQIQKTVTLAAAQVVIANARAALREVPFDVLDKAHARLAAKPYPPDRDGLIAMLMDRLQLHGESRQLVKAAAELVSQGEVIPYLMPESMIGTESLTQDTHRTQMAVTDEGYDHLRFTLADPRMLNGAWLHIERIARVDSEGKPSTHNYPYGLPPPWLVSTIRLFLAGANAAGDEGVTAPFTVFYGSPNYRSSAVTDGARLDADDVQSASMKANRDKAVGDLSWAATSAFLLGASEFKVTMDGLSSTEAVQLMKGVTESMAPWREGQTVSAAFNLIKGIKDLEVRGPRAKPLGGTPSEKDRADMLEVGRRAIKVTQEGGWKKLTLDSASMTPPSYPLIEFFGVANTLTWAHEAHQAGLETYVSGGMIPDHFPLLALTGVDGVGVGNSIHEKTSNSGVPGNLVPGRVNDALSRRDRAEQTTWVGQAIYALRRLDEKVSLQDRTDALPLSHGETGLRHQLFETLLGVAKDIDAKLETLKATRDATLAELKQQKDAGALTPEAFSKQEGQAREDFRVAMNGVVDAAIFDGASPTSQRCKALSQEAVKLGYPLRGNPEQAA